MSASLVGSGDVYKRQKQSPNAASFVSHRLRRARQESIQHGAVVSRGGAHAHAIIATAARGFKHAAV
eukprot:11699487-Alexandrium_andersonii.AAC.1